MVLNQIAENIAYKLGDQFNFTLRESIKNTLINYRAKYIRDDLERNFLSHIDFLQTVTLKLKEVDVLDEFEASLCKVAINCIDKVDRDKYKVLRTETKIPRPVRLKNWGGPGYKYLGTVDHISPFHFTTFEEHQYRKTLPYQNNLIYYTVVNQYLYVINNLEVCDVLLEGIFADPREAYKTCRDNTFSDDSFFPIGEDMLMSIERNIVSGEYPIRGKDGEEINIKHDENDRD